MIAHDQGGWNGFQHDGRNYIDVLDFAGSLRRFAAETRQENPESIVADAYEATATMLEGLRFEARPDGAA